MGRGSSKAGGGSQAKQKSMRDIQIESLERRWGSGKALKPSDIKPGDRISGMQYQFEEMIERPNEYKTAWSGTYDNNKISVSADNHFRVMSVKVGKDSTEIIAEKIGGAEGMTAKKKIKNDRYLRVWR